MTLADRSARGAVTAGLALLVVLGAVRSSDPLWLAMVAAGVGILGAAGVTVAEGRRRVAASVVVIAAVAVLGAASASNFGWFATCVLVAGVAATTGPRAGVLLLGLTYAALVVALLVVSHDPGWSAWFGGSAISLLGGLLVHRERGLREVLREAQAGLADQARLEERSRIAREMHDVIGHALTVSLLHISSARLALAEDPTEADASLAEAERLSRESLTEVRTAVGSMRGAGSTPLPGAAELDGLLESFRRAGTPLASDVVGDLASLNASQGLTVYRILQESLTNVARHAPGSPVRVQVIIDGWSTRVLVESDGVPDPAAAPGNGVLGMRERAEAVGGRLTAGPWRAGWRVEAVLPA